MHTHSAAASFQQHLHPECPIHAHACSFHSTFPPCKPPAHVHAPGTLPLQKRIDQVKERQKLALKYLGADDTIRIGGYLAVLESLNFAFVSVRR